VAFAAAGGSIEVLIWEATSKGIVPETCLGYDYSNNAIQLTGWPRQVKTPIPL